MRAVLNFIHGFSAPSAPAAAAAPLPAAAKAAPKRSHARTNHHSSAQPTATSPTASPRLRSAGIVSPDHSGLSLLLLALMLAAGMAALLLLLAYRRQAPVATATESRPDRWRGLGQADRWRALRHGAQAAVGLVALLRHPRERAHDGDAAGTRTAPSASVPAPPVSVPAPPRTIPTPPATPPAGRPTPPAHGTNGASAPAIEPAPRTARRRALREGLGVALASVSAGAMALIQRPRQAAQRRRETKVSEATSAPERSRADTVPSVPRPAATPESEIDDALATFELGVLLEQRGDLAGA
jgi:hypothetical protein